MVWAFAFLFGFNLCELCFVYVSWLCTCLIFPNTSFLQFLWIMKRIITYIMVMFCVIYQILYLISTIYIYIISKSWIVTFIVIMFMLSYISISVQFSSFWTTWVHLVHFDLFDLFLSTLVHFGPFSPFQSTLVNFSPIWFTSVYFNPIWTKWALNWFFCRFVLSILGSNFFFFWMKSIKFYSIFLKPFSFGLKNTIKIGIRN